jgi:CheY-like chemotaxis protein
MGQRVLAGISTWSVPDAVRSERLAATEEGGSGSVPSGGSIDRLPGERPDPESRRILVVEDDAHVGHLFRRLLERMDCRVLLETSAPPALERIRSGQRYELVISDIVLPGEMDGVDLLAAIRRRDPDQPVMLTTGYDRHALRDLPEELEGVDLLRKPFRRQDLEALVGRLLA